MELLTRAATVVQHAEAGSLLVFAFVVAAFVVSNWRGLFVPRHARLHRWTGVVYFSLLVVGAVDASRGLVVGKAKLGLPFDAVLGVAGVAIAVTAALDFGYAHDEAKFVSNPGSGTLEDTATVTKGEMWEHSFYQLLLLAQILFVHAVGDLTRADPTDVASRLVGLFLVTAPWYFRSRIPINSFSKNYSDAQKAWTVYGVLYRIKKYQYVFLKHVLIHGLNITLAVRGHPTLASDVRFRFYWILVNWSYTMEFFLQTLVKKRRMEQSTLLVLQKLLMAVASVGSVSVIYAVDPVAAAVSCFLNFTHRGHEMVNTALATGVAWGVSKYLFSSSSL